jgi:hypothetical protein
MKKWFVLAAMLTACPAPMNAQSDAPILFDRTDNRIVANMGGKCGYVDENGKWAIPAIYDSASPFYADGLASVSAGEERIFINKKGEKVFSLPKGVWDSDWSRQDEYIQVDNGKGGGFVDRTGNLVIAPTWNEVNGFDGYRLAPVKRTNKLPGSQGLGEWGYIDRKGALTVPVMFSYASSFKDGKAEVILAGQNYLLSEDGTLTPKAARKPDLSPAPNYKAYGIEGLIYITEPNAAGFATADIRAPGKSFNMIVGKDRKPIGRQYSYIVLDNDTELFPAQIGNKYEDIPTPESHGFINAKGEVAIPFIYSLVHGFNGGDGAIAVYKGKYGMIDRKGKWRIKPKFDRLGECQQLGVRMER